MIVKNAIVSLIRPCDRIDERPFFGERKSKPDIRRVYSASGERSHPRFMRLSSVTHPAQFNPTVLDATVFGSIVSNREFRAIALRVEIVANAFLTKVSRNRL